MIHSSQHHGTSYHHGINDFQSDRLQESLQIPWKAALCRLRFPSLQNNDWTIVKTLQKHLKARVQFKYRGRLKNLRVLEGITIIWRILFQSSSLFVITWMIFSEVTCKLKKPTDHFPTLESKPGASEVQSHKLQTWRRLHNALCPLQVHEYFIPREIFTPRGWAGRVAQRKITQSTVVFAPQKPMDLRICPSKGSLFGVTFSSFRVSEAPLYLFWSFCRAMARWESTRFLGDSF